MKKVLFTQDFYKHLYEAIMDAADNVVFDYEADGYPDTFEVDGYSVDATIYYGWEVHDDSFDHAFGTWHDPYPYMEVSNLHDIDKVQVYDEDDEEVEGFDYEAFMGQFEEPSCLFAHRDMEKRCIRQVKVNSGDKVLYYGQEAVFLSKNKENGLLKIKTEKGITYTYPKNVKLATI